MAREQQRNIGDEILEDLQAVKAPYKGKVTLQTYKVEPAPLPEVDAQRWKPRGKKCRKIDTLQSEVDNEDIQRERAPKQ
jgi:hypothetical protein